MFIHRYKDRITIQLANGFQIELKLEDDYLLGIGAVQYQGRHLRNPDYTLRPFLKSIEGLSFDRWKLISAECADNVVRVATQVSPAVAADLEWQDAFNHEFVTVPRPDGFAQPVELVWEFGEYEENVCGATIPGFYFSFRLDTTSEFHSYILQGTWEINQFQQPVTVIAQRAGSLPWEARLQIPDRLYTHESIDLGSGNNSPIQIREGLTIPQETVIWQMMPRGSGSQTFDFQATAEGWIATYHPAPKYVQACQRKEAGSPVIAHLERHYFPRRQGVESGKHVALAHFPTGGLTLEQIRDDWSDLYDTVNGLWRKRFNYTEDELDTGYSPTLWDDVLRAEPLAYQRVLAMIPHLARYGVKRLFTGIWWKSHFTERIADEALCHIMEYTLSEKYGGVKLLKEICDVAHQQGMKVFYWCLGTVSRQSPMHQEHPDWICYDRNSAPSVAIGHPLLYCMDYNTGWSDYFAERMLKLKEQAGIDGLFIDSYHNLNFQVINYADPDLRTNMPGLIAWQRRMREAGLELMIETSGIFGASLNWLDRGYLKTEANAGIEHTFYKSILCLKTYWLTSGRIDEAFCYRAMANNAPIRLETDFNSPDELIFPHEAWERFLARINRDYQAVRDRMIRRRTLSGDRGVEWMDADRRRVLALFSFSDSTYPVPDGLSIFDVTMDEEVPVCDGAAEVHKFHTYRVDA